ncbi:MAG TPA: hypothetical protein VF331_19170 [Polyangiales bacterium]
MLDVIHTPAERQPEPAPRTTRHRFAFGGVAFEILADEGVQWALPAAYQRYVHAVSEGPVVADVFCSVVLDRVAVVRTNPPSHRLELDTQAHGMRMHSAYFRADLTRVSSQRYAVTARLSQHPKAVVALLLALTSGVVQLASGVSTHATKIDLEAGLAEPTELALREFIAAHEPGGHHA